MIRKFRPSLLATALTLVLGTMTAPAWADIAPKWSDAELVGFSEVILTGTVLDIASATDETGNIYTYVTVGVGEVLKGWIFERQVVIKQLGGRLNGVSLVAHGQPTFEVGETALLFLEVRPRDNSLYTTALWQGKWHLETDALGQQIASRSEPGFENRGILQSREVRQLAGFVGQVRRLSGANATRPGRLLNTLPPETPTGGAVAANAAPYTFLGPARWHQIDSGSPVVVDLQPNGQPGLAGGGGSQLVAAAGLWMGAGSRFAWVAGNLGAAVRCKANFADTGRTLITYMDPCGEIDDSGGTLAVGGFWSGSPIKNVNGEVFEGIAEGFLVFNDSSSAVRFLTNPGCFQDVATHELGHSIGFGHSADPAAIMFPTINNDCFSSAHALGADDVSLIRFAYPSATTSPPGAPSGLVGSKAGATVTLTWNAPASGGAPAAYIIEAGSAPGLSNLANFSTGSTATSYSASGVPPGTYYVRVRATNGSGTSGASNEIVLTVP